MERPGKHKYWRAAAAGPRALVALAALLLIALALGTVLRSALHQKAEDFQGTSAEQATTMGNGSGEPATLADFLYGLILLERKGRPVDRRRIPALLAILERARTLESESLPLLEIRMDSTLTAAQRRFLRESAPFLSYRRLKREKIKEVCAQVRKIAGTEPESHIAHAKPREGLSIITPFCNGFDRLQERADFSINRKQACAIVPILEGFLTYSQALESEVMTPLGDLLAQSERAFIEANLGRLRSMAEKERPRMGDLIKKVSSRITRRY
jgi:hypothetical protein